MTKKISICALFTAFAVILSYVETMLPSVAIPGVKLGLANFSILLILYLIDGKYAFLVNVCRILIIGFMFGNLFTIVFSLVGATVSILAMIIMKKIKVSIITVSMVGGVAHNLGQIIVAGFIVESYSVFYYLPTLIIVGMITGTVIGILIKLVYKRIEQFFIKAGVIE